MLEIIGMCTDDTNMITDQLDESPLLLQLHCSDFH